MPLLTFVVTLLVIGILWWCVQRLVQALAIREPVATVIYVVFAILVCVYLVGVITGRPWIPLF